MQLGVGLDARLRLSWDEQRELVREAARLGYASAWTPAAAVGRDAFHTCVQWHAASGLPTGISVVPAPFWTVPTLAMQAATVGELTGGQFILGIGEGGAYAASTQRAYGLPALSPVAQMHDYLVSLRELLAGQTVDYAGRGVTLHGVALAFRPPRVPVYLAALGPRMLRLAGELADGVLPNWASPEQIAWCRERVAEAARLAGRDPGSIPVVQYIRVCVDADEDAARRALAEQVLGYAMARPGVSKDQGYRGHFGRMGFDEVLTELEARREAGAPQAELVDAIPAELLRRVGYFGRPEGAAAAFRRLAEGLDVAIVRVIAARPGVEAVATTLEALRPELVADAG
jgi:alkanesulfonate monooxygenase SsuD/methylene tetrahydromethanopterin reductase-like flavin-dependent oxidoreductase (luciferase family)